MFPTSGRMFLTLGTGVRLRGASHFCTDRNSDRSQSSMRTARVRQSACIPRRHVLGGPSRELPLTPCFSMLQRPWNRLHRARFRVSSKLLRRPKSDVGLIGRCRGDVFRSVTPRRRFHARPSLVGKRHITEDRILPLRENCGYRNRHCDPGGPGRMTEGRKPACG